MNELLVLIQRLMVALLQTEKERDQLRAELDALQEFAVPPVKDKKKP